MNNEHRHWSLLASPDLNMCPALACLDTMCAASPLLQHLSRRVNELDLAMATVQESLKPMHDLKAALDNRAAISASRYIWLLTSGILAGAGGYWYLVYVHFSWDIMEPVTFFTGLGVSTSGYAWWMATNKAYEYSNVYDFFLQRAQDRG
jgi:Mitochondrial calcium uniporter